MGQILIQRRKYVSLHTDVVVCHFMSLKISGGMKNHEE